MKKGFSVFELVGVMFIMSIAVTVLMVNAVNAINRARFQATVREMQSIAQASVEYYDSSSSNGNSLYWPSTVNDLVPTYMFNAPIQSPLGGSYQLNSANNMITISTSIPKGILVDPLEGDFLNISPGINQDTISITQSVPNDFTYQVKN